MAKFGSYFGLCPLIDHRSLLGISKDAEDGKVLVTLGKNIAMQYRLADQKQILSWTTKEKFTSPVIFDSEINKYVAVFNLMYIRCWEYKELNLDKVKKLKFKTNIETIVVINNTSFVVFKNGSIVKLTEAILNHKSMEPERVIEENEYISDIIFCVLKTDIYVGLLIASSDLKGTPRLVWTVFDSQGNRAEYSWIRLKKTSCELVGSIFHLSDNVELLTLWSDGTLYVKSLETKSDDPGEMFSIIESISCKDLVSLVSLNKDYIALYGGNSNQEGAILIIYNMQFKVTQCRQPFKLLTMGAKLWQVQENLILPVGQNLAVVPYHLEKEQLSALVGSHKSQSDNSKDVFVVQNLEEVVWSIKNDIPTNKIKTRLKNTCKGYLEQGCSESIIFQEILPIYIEKNDINSLVLLLKTFDDIPEKEFIEVLQYFLEVSSQVFKNSEPHSDSSYPTNLQPYERYRILTLILEKPVNEVYLVPNLRAKLNLDNVLKLLSFILFLLVEDNMFNAIFVKKLIDWVSFILDANYQTFRLSKNENVLKILLSFDELVNNELGSLEDFQKLLSVIEQASKKKKITKIVGSNYVVEKIDL